VVGGGVCGLSSLEGEGLGEGGGEGCCEEEGEEGGDGGEMHSWLGFGLLCYWF